MTGRRMAVGVTAVLAVVLLGVLVNGVTNGFTGRAATPGPGPGATSSPATTVPSLLGLDARTGVAQLRAVALAPDVERVRPRCGEPAGTVLGSTPAPGTTVGAGDRVRLRVAAPSPLGDLGAPCLVERQVWELLRLARGVASAPRLGVRVEIRDGGQHRSVAAANLVDRDAWRACEHCGSVLTALATAAAAPDGGGTTTLLVAPDQGAGGCDRSRAGSATGGSAADDAAGSAAVSSVTVAVGVRTATAACDGLLDVGVDADGRIVAVRRTP